MFRRHRGPRGERAVQTIAPAPAMAPQWPPPVPRATACGKYASTAATRAELEGNFGPTGNGAGERRDAQLVGLRVEQHERAIGRRIDELPGARAVQDQLAANRLA